MATMDIIKLYGQEPVPRCRWWSFKRKVAAAKLILSDKNVKYFNKYFWWHNEM